MLMLAATNANTATLQLRQQLETLANTRPGNQPVILSAYAKGLNRSPLKYVTMGSICNEAHHATAKSPGGPPFHPTT
jgi:hypothetical protein